MSDQAVASGGPKHPAKASPSREQAKRSYQRMVNMEQERHKKLAKAQSRGMASLRRESFFNHAFGEHRNDTIDAKDMQKAAGEMVYDGKRGSFNFIKNPRSRLANDALEKTATRSDPGCKEVILTGRIRNVFGNEGRRDSEGQKSAVSAASSRSQKSSLMSKSVRKVRLGLEAEQVTASVISISW